MPSAGIGAIIQARAGSTRLKNKVLLKLPFDGPYSIVQNIVRRAQNIESVSVVCVATSTDPANDRIALEAADAGAEVTRGSENDVLARFHDVATQYKLGTIVRLTGDNPCIAPAIIGEALQAHLRAESDYTRSTGLPVGMNVEIISYEALTRAHEEATAPDDREHVTLFMNRFPERFRIKTIDLHKQEYDGLRMTIDWESDYAFACFLYEHLYAENQCFELDAVMDLLEKYPWARQINGALPQERHATVGLLPSGHSTFRREESEAT